MVKIILTNELPDAAEKKAIIDLSTSTCLINDDFSISLSEFKKLAFKHPILEHPGLELKDGLYSYTYEDIEGLAATPRWVYATLLRVKDVKNCHFKVTPSKKYMRSKMKYQFYFSMDYLKPATETIDLNQLNQIISDLTGAPFQYMDTLLINQSFSYEHLPPEVKGDRLFYVNAMVMEYLSNPERLEKFELRYINRLMRFGVFAREKIHKGDPVVLYCGTKEVSQPEIANYYFLPNVDILNMGTDSKSYGNIGRFINHAPNQNTSPEEQNLIEANVVSDGYFLNGLLVYVYDATRDIEKNEQIFIDYGNLLFHKYHALRFNTQSQSLDEDNKVIKENFAQRVPMLRAVLRAGVRSAFLPLYKRLIFVVLVFIIFILIMHKIF